MSMLFACPAVAEVLPIPILTLHGGPGHIWLLLPAHLFQRTRGEAGFQLPLPELISRAQEPHNTPIIDHVWPVTRVISFPWMFL